MPRSSVLVVLVVLGGALTTGAPLAAVEAESRAARWAPRLDLEVKPGSDRMIGESRLMMPFWQDGSSFLFTDTRFTATTSDEIEGNLGLGYRRAHQREGRLGWGWGVYSFFDRKRSDDHNWFSQTTLGFDILTELLEFRMNGYLPVSGAETMRESSASLSGTNVLVQDQRERALAGFDTEVGVQPLASWVPGLWAFGGYYRFDHDKTQAVEGPRARVEYISSFIGDTGARFVVGGEFRHDDFRGSDGYATARIEIPLGASGADRREFEGVKSRLDRPIVRDVDVLAIPAEKVARGNLVDPATGEDVNVFFIDSDGSVAGTGTQADPMTLAQASAAMGDSDVLFLLGGDGDIAQGGTTLTLGVNQSVRGVGQGTKHAIPLPQGMRLDVVDEGGRPTLSQSGGADAIALADGNVLSGISVTGGNIAGASFDDFTMTGVTLSGGILTMSDVGGDVTILGSQFTAQPADVAVVLDNGLGDKSVALTMIENDFDSGGLRVFTGGTADATVSLVFENYDSTVAEAVILDASGDSILDFFATASGFADSGDDHLRAMYADNSAGSIDVRLSSFSGGAGDGIEVMSNGNALLDVSNNFFVGVGDSAGDHAVQFDGGGNTRILGNNFFGTHDAAVRVNLAGATDNTFVDLVFNDFEDNDMADAADGVHVSLGDAGAEVCLVAMDNFSIAGDGFTLDNAIGGDFGILQVDVPTLEFENGDMPVTSAGTLTAGCVF